MRVHGVRDEARVREFVREAHILKVLLHAGRHAHDLLSPHAELVAVHL